MSEDSPLDLALKGLALWCVLDADDTMDCVSDAYWAWREMNLVVLPVAVADYYALHARIICEEWA